MLSTWAFDFCSLIDRARELMLRGNASQRHSRPGKWDWLVVAGRSLISFPKRP
jgi:hypothetical protein